MAGHKITLKFTGRKAVAVLLVLLAVVGWLAVRYLSPSTSLPDNALNAMKVALRFEYSQALTAKYGITPDRMPDQKSAERFAQELAESEKIDISDLRVRGVWRKRVSRFQVAVAGHTPPDGRSLRYMRIARVPLTGHWTAFATAAPAYHLKFW